MNALLGRGAKVRRQPDPAAIEDQQAQQGRRAVHRFHGDGRKAVLTHPGFLPFRQALRHASLPVRGQHAARRPAARQGTTLGGTAGLQPTGWPSASAMLPLRIMRPLVPARPGG